MSGACVCVSGVCVCDTRFGGQLQRQESFGLVGVDAC